GVKKLPGGKFSTYVNDHLRVGDVLEVAPPKGRFFVEPSVASARNYVAFAAGSGITPIISIIKTHLATEPNATFKLFYINQHVASIMLKEELEALKNLYLDRFEIFYFLTREHRETELFNGRIDTHKLDTIFKTICDVEGVDHFFSCGPESMTLMISEYLREKGVGKKQIHFELFTTSGASVERREEVAQHIEGAVADVTIREGGKSFNFKIAQGKDNILDAALQNSADMPFACKGGVCCTCRAKLIEGEVEMLLNYGLEDDEVADGYILTCQAIPTSKKVLVDFDA
ncbi:MAG: 2Fe-2S iron-sulfur cluster-binding protein, partial [Bacteroidota bacterium]